MDIKLENIMIDVTTYDGKTCLSLILIDFGESREIITITMTVAGTPDYMAPELIFKIGNPTSAVDIFSFGVALHKIIEGFKRETVWENKKEFRLFEIKTNIGKSLKPLMDWCVTENPKYRPTAAHLLIIF